MADNKCAFPRNVTLELTEVCNLRCKMCYFWGETGSFSKAESGRKPVTMEWDMLKRIIEELKPAKPIYSLFGGEPLTYPHLEEMIVAIKEGGSVVDTPTNGTLVEKHAEMLVRTGFDSVRVSIDGTRETSDAQRGKDSFDKAMAGIEALKREKQKAGKMMPLLSIIYTVTPENYLSIEDFFLRDLDLPAMTWITIQMQNFITDKMGAEYSKMLEDSLGIKGDRYWPAMVRTPEDFRGIDVNELARQVAAVQKRCQELGKHVLLLPKQFTPENLSAYLNAKWADMPEKYRKCLMPWTGVDITANGDVAPCHIFFDLVLGNVKKSSFEEVWNGEKYKSFRAYMEKNGLMPICNGCCVLYIVGL